MGGAIVPWPAGWERRPEVLAIAGATGLSRAHVLGALVQLWGCLAGPRRRRPALAVAQLPGLVPETDARFWAAALAAGWIGATDAGEMVPLWLAAEDRRRDATRRRVQMHRQRRGNAAVTPLVTPLLTPLVTPLLTPLVTPLPPPDPPLAAAEDLPAAASSHSAGRVTVTPAGATPEEVIGPLPPRAPAAVPAANAAAPSGRGLTVCRRPADQAPTLEPLAPEPQLQAELARRGLTARVRPADPALIREALAYYDAERAALRGPGALRSMIEDPARWGFTRAADGHWCRPPPGAGSAATAARAAAQTERQARLRRQAEQQAAEAARVRQADAWYARWNHAWEQLSAAAQEALRALVRERLPLWAARGGATFHLACLRALEARTLGGPP